jgi:spore coat polysaccharide biosynthesis protein SpsF
MEFNVKVVAIIQARMGSTRLPGKVLEEINGLPMLDLIINRINAASLVSETIVAIPDDFGDDVLKDWLHLHGIKYFRGSEMDVLQRFYMCALECEADLVVRVTADDPLKDPEIVDYAVRCILDRPELDYVSNTLNPTYPEGLDIEVFKFSALKKAHLEAKLSSEREHVTPYIWKNAELFTVHNFLNARNLSKWRWTVDKFEDLIFIRTVMAHFKDHPLVGYREIVKHLDANPHLLEINGNKTIRNEGYIKSTLEDRK